MKCLLMIGSLTLFFSVAYAQNNIVLHQPINPGNAEFKDIKPQNNYIFTPITEPELLNKTFMKDNSDAGSPFTPGVNKIVDLVSMPGYYRPGEMMSTVSMCSTVGKLKFYCNYYFDAAGQLQDGDITITKKK